MPTNQCTDENNAFTPTGSLIIITVDISKAFLVSANAIEILSLALCPIPLSSSLQKLYLETSGVLTPMSFSFPTTDKLRLWEDWLKLFPSMTINPAEMQLLFTGRAPAVICEVPLRS